MLTKNLLKPILVAAMAIFLGDTNSGCKPPFQWADELEQVYRNELSECVKKSTTRRASCECRLAVDEKWKLCDHPEYPRIGRCDFRCEGIKD